MERPIAGRTIAVTGAARGIGLAIAAGAARAGARVVLGDLDADEAAAQAARLGGGASGHALDVTDPASFAAFLDTAGPVDVLVNNAGVMWVGPFGEEDDSAAHTQMEVNFFGVRTGVRLAAERRVGHVVTVASAASKVAPPGEATYAATKHAVYGYLKAVRRELAGQGIELTVVMPAVVETELARGTDEGRAAKRLTPEEVADAVLGAIRKPRFEVHIPATIGPLLRFQALLPQRARDLLDRAFVPDQALGTDQAARADYERRRVG